MNKFESLTIAAVAVTALAMAPLTAMAQDDEAPPPLSDVWIMVPKQGMESDFEEAIKTHMAFRVDAGESWQWNTYTPVAGDRLDMYQFRYCCFDWADMDDYMAEEAQEAMGTHWDETVHPYVDHYHHYFERTDWENSHWPEGDGEGPYYEVTTWTWKADAGSSSGEARKKMSQAAIEHGWGDTGANWMWMFRMHGKPKLMLVSSFEDYADMAMPDPGFFEFMSEALSEEEVESMFADFDSGFSSVETTLWRHRPELSTPRGGNRGDAGSD